MQLLTEELKKKLPRLYSQEADPNPFVQSFLQPIRIGRGGQQKASLTAMISGSSATSAAWKKNGGISCYRNSKRHEGRSDCR